MAASPAAIESGAEPGTGDDGPATPDDLAVGVGRAFVDGIVRRDFDGLEALFAPGVRFRAIIPRAVCEADSASGACAWLEDWFGEVDRNELLDARVEMMADRLHVAYRIRLHEPVGWRIVEQQAFASVVDARIADLALVCSGFRPTEVGTERQDALPRADVRLDAIGRSCATFTPDIRRAVAKLEPGQTLEIVADDPTAEADLRSWTRLTGNEVVGIENARGAERHFFVRRGPGRGANSAAAGKGDAK